MRSMYIKPLTLPVVHSLSYVDNDPHIDYIAPRAPAHKAHSALCPNNAHALIKAGGGL